MATGRIGVTPVLGTRWSIEPAGGTTSLSGLDANSVSLVYSVGYEQVYRNGVLLSRGNDYTATNGTSITLTDATIAGDIIEVFAQELLPLTDAISKGQFTAKGSILSASAASTPAVLAVGTNGQVLKADSSTTTGLAWGTDTSGALTKITDGSFTSASTVTVDNVFTSTYKRYKVFVRYIFVTTGGTLQWQFRYSTSTETGSTYFGSGFRQNRSNTKSDYGFASATYATIDTGGATNANSFFWMDLDQVGNSSQIPYASQTGLSSDSQAVMQSTIYNSQARTYTGFLLTPSAGTLTGEYVIYGVQN